MACFACSYGTRHTRLSDSHRAAGEASGAHLAECFPERVVLFNCAVAVVHGGRCPLLRLRQRNLLLVAGRLQSGHSGCNTQQHAEDNRMLDCWLTLQSRNLLFLAGARSRTTGQRQRQTAGLLLNVFNLPRRTRKSANAGQS